MINKKNIWFLTLFSLILALSVYYVTMPSELLLDVYSNYGNDDDDVTLVESSDIITVHRLENIAEVEAELDILKLIILNNESTTEEKNDAYDQMKDIQHKRGEESSLEEKIKVELNYNAFVKINGNEISVIVDSDTHDISLANRIMKLIQKNYNEKKYISVKFN